MFRVAGKRLKMCSGETTCCTQMMESKLSVESRQEFDTNLKNLLNPMAILLAKKNVKLNEVFGKLLNNSRKNFDNMFSRTYGIIYQQNAFVFTKLYDDLEKYFSLGELDLQETMDDFFERLYQRMFTVYNSQYTFSSRYLRCVTRHMEQLKPFGDVPKKLTTQIKRSFVALRTFAQGLATGRDVVKNVLKVNPSVSCVHELMRMTHCATCEGHQGVVPCLSYCQDVINLCLSHHQHIISHWIAYVDAMVNVGERLENPFNIENVVQPVNYKVSDAVMNFQEAGHDISNKVFNGCGPPRLGRSKRQEPVKGELSQEFLDFSANNRQEKKRDKETENISVSKHVHEIKSKIKNAREFWSELPTKMCRDAARDGAMSCWTGTKLGKYEGKSGLNVTESPPSSDMNEQIMRLKVITSKLQEAYKGRDVSWIDDESWLTNGGKQDEEAVSDDGDVVQEGSGSGDGPTHVNYPPDDEDAYVRGNAKTDSKKPADDYVYDDDEDDYQFNHRGRENVGSGNSYKDYDYRFEGSGGDWNGMDDDLEGSGVYGKTHNPNLHNPSPYDPYEPPSKPHQPTDHNAPKDESDQPPSAAAKETMSLNRAITIYMLPAFIMFLGSLA
ncbi:glypican-4-like [Homarus americanus]|uniref:glypican-4-like n=1 Tax=Homarus americanus TaxID=6706 RepID=UPI001C471076|nr:glypican-4-like [Homarus americanus]